MSLNLKLLKKKKNKSLNLFQLLLHQALAKDHLPLFLQLLIGVHSQDAVENNLKLPLPQVSLLVTTIRTSLKLRTTILGVSQTKTTSLLAQKPHQRKRTNILRKRLPHRRLVAEPF